MSLTRRTFLISATALLVAGCTAVAPPAGSSTPAALTTATIVSTINATRKTAGREPLTYNQKLEQAARTHAQLMASRETLSHTIGGSLRERVTAAGYTGAVGENLGAGQKTLEIIIQAWLDSKGHRSTLLSPKFKEFGLAAARSASGKTYWAFIAGGDFSAWY